jgi:imidazole glycerol-phosphate synthase subunit HisH
MTEIVAIVDYGSGNLHSAAKAFEREAALLDAPPAIRVTADAEIVRRADRIVLPGVGAFADCRAGLLAVPGMREALEERVIEGGAPFLGICVGMQLMAQRGLEKGMHQGLGWIGGEVRRIEPIDPSFKVPHIGWNTLHFTQAHPLLAGLTDGEDGLHAYFVHSYHMAPRIDSELMATTDYGGPVTAAVGRDNMFGTQFHPEKSQTLGLALIRNFLRWRV